MNTYYAVTTYFPVDHLTHGFACGLTKSGCKLQHYDRLFWAIQECMAE